MIGTTNGLDPSSVAAYGFEYPFGMLVDVHDGETSATDDVIGQPDGRVAPTRQRVLQARTRLAGTLEGPIVVGAGTALRGGGPR